ncbi:MAG TPA: hypothetical protein VFB60_25895 [Ktedonobacteraceae bacterium]|nr:hypothetical protein [Ktedonobacteraceae bacterium]
MSSEKKPIVLLIEADISLRRLIALGLQSRNMQVIEVDTVASLPAIGEGSQQPDLLVLDIDSDIHCDWSSLAIIQSHARLSQLPTVVLTWESEPAQELSTLMQTQVIYQAKPFDARTLLATIEQLLSIRAAQQAAIEAREEEALLAAYAVHTAPSIWPIVTAMGLLLAVVGLLFQVAISIVGCLIVIVALLLWALRAQPAPDRVAVSSIL